MTLAELVETRPGVLNLEQALEAMVTIRAFEHRLLELFRSGSLAGTTHTCIGQEANAVGIAAALQAGDVIVSNHRGHGHFIAHVGDVDGLMAEIMGRATGVCGGWGGSQHLCRPGAFYSNGIQGGIAPLATGIAVAEKLRSSGNVVVVFLGDGTFGEGAVYEAMNLAALLSAPVLFAVEDNGIAQTTLTEVTTAGSHAARAAAFGIPCVELEYPTVDQVFNETSRLLPDVRSRGPAMLRIVSARLEAHSKSDDTRSDDLMEQLRALDPLARTQADVPAACVAEIATRAQQRIDAAVAAAISAPEPRGLDSVMTVTGRDGVVEESLPRAHEQQSCAVLAGLAGRTMREQLNDALHRLMQRDSDIILLGEDLVDPYGGAFKVTAGLSTAYPERVLPMPISEGAMVGLAGGLAIHGYRPVVELMFGDFTTLAMDQLVNHLAKYREMYNSQVQVPVVVRVPMGGHRGYGPTHSQTLDKMIVGVPGLTVLAPTYVHPVKQMLECALYGDGPVVFIENKVAYNDRVETEYAGMVDDFFVHFSADEAAPLLTLSLTEFQDDGVTIVTYGGMLSAAMAAAKALFMEQEIACRIVAPGRLYPLHGADIVHALPATGPIVTFEEASPAFGFGAEVGSLLAERSLMDGRAFLRIGAKDHVIAASRVLEAEVLPDAEQLVAAIIGIVDGTQR